MQNKKIILISMITLSIILLLGTSYSLLRSRDIGENSYVMNVGLLEVTFIDSETSTLTLENAVPISDEEGISQSDELVFTVKNTGDFDATYNVYIEEISTSPEFKTVIRFISKKNEEGYNSPKTLSEDNYIDQEASLSVGETATYKVKLWLDEQADNTYMNQKFSARIVIETMINQTKTGAELLLETIGVGGLVAINTEGTLYSGTGEIREYRYSGATANNYVIFNDDGDSTIEDNELWRIVGIFKNSSGKWNLKLMRNTILTTDELANEFIPGDGSSYLIEEGTSGNVYWDASNLSNNDTNDWTTAGLQYFLNYDVDVSNTSGYYATFTDKAKQLIDSNYTYYLGNVRLEISGTTSNTAISSYDNERGTIECSSTITSNTHSNNCNIWNGHEKQWQGSIALLYPSDYAYSFSSDNWTSPSNYLAYYTSESWMIQTANLVNNEWLISPGSRYDNFAAFKKYDGMMGDADVNSTSGVMGIRPCLNLLSKAPIDIEHEGSLEDPYLILE